jgi:hypothetical protein
MHVDGGVRCDGEVGNGGFLLVEGNTNIFYEKQCVSGRTRSKVRGGFPFRLWLFDFFSWLGEGSYSLHKSRRK